MKMSKRSIREQTTPMFPIIAEQTEPARGMVMKYWEALRAVDKPRRDPVLTHVEKILTTVRINRALACIGR